MLDDWIHLHTPGLPDAPVLLMLHGTGSNERDIAGLAGMLHPDATVLSPRGRVSENGMNRWFRRLSEGVFDVEDVVTRSAELVDFIARAREAYGLEGRQLIAVGLSNGANIALATALLRPDVIDRVVAFSGMFPLDDRELDTDLSASAIFLANGVSDPMAPHESVNRLVAALDARGAEVTRSSRPGGHGIDQADFAAAQEWLRQHAA
ncbi:alpha/beta hydrolase [Marisediminicola senii]|uniref:alpha/beta hydrolase n=1 Tax=Marisediminicola senii TaxID=2711233 RepID=UPI001F19432C|nr:alpha/beta hydrolase [Marisediminicola senii]